MNLEVEPPDFEETVNRNYSRSPLGESSKSCCKVNNGNSCGSGSIVGERNGKTLVLTNAHVAGSRIGHTVVCTFPFDGNKRYRAKVIMAAYSDRVMMDWAVLELESKVPLPVVKLSIAAPTGENYTGGYPRCQGPYFQRLRTTRITHNGTVWRWQPISIGGQSGSGVHSFEDNLQRGLLTWSWGGDGAGQTTRSIWLQYANRAALGFARPEGLVELSDKAEGLESGFFAEANITDLPIWDHLDEEPEPDDPTPEPPSEDAKAFAKEVHKQATALAETAKKFLTKGPCDPINKPEDDPGDDNEADGPLFGL